MKAHRVPKDGNVTKEVKEGVVEGEIQRHDESAK